MLIDSSSTHNFLDLNIAINTLLVIHKEFSLVVKISNADVIKSEGCCCNATFKVQGETFSTNFYLLPFGGCDAVLGIKWLGTLGPISWDFSKLTMQFTHNEKPYQLQRLTLHHLSFIKHSEARLNLISGGKGLLLQISQEGLSTGEGKLPE